MFGGMSSSGLFDFQNVLRFFDISKITSSVSLMIIYYSFIGLNDLFRSVVRRHI